MKIQLLKTGKTLQNRLHYRLIAVQENQQVEWQSEYQIQDWTLEKVLRRHLESLRNPFKLERKKEYKTLGQYEKK
jgi:hypothetical protein